MADITLQQAQQMVDSWIKTYGVRYFNELTNMTILTEEMVQAFPNAILNIHPALIPSFCGQGFYGLHVHEAALAYGVKLSGATVHFVSAECDGGPIIAQKAVSVLPGDTPETLQKRIMEQAEWKLLPEAVRLFCEGRLRVEGRTVIIEQE